MRAPSTAAVSTRAAAPDSQLSEHHPEHHDAAPEVTMAGQEQRQPQHGRHDEDPADAPEPVPAAPATQTRDAEVDALLDEIDEVLESNAESFVRGFVQKGGQ